MKDLILWWIEVRWGLGKITPRAAFPLIPTASMEGRNQMGGDCLESAWQAWHVPRRSITGRKTKSPCFPCEKQWKQGLCNEFILTVYVYLYRQPDAIRFCTKQIQRSRRAGFDLICHMSLCSTQEQQAVFHVALYGGDQHICNAVGISPGEHLAEQRWRGLCGIFSPAMTCCMKGFIIASSIPPPDFLTMAMSSFAAWIRGFFQPDVCVTFFRWDKSGFGDLNAVHQDQDMLYPRAWRCRRQLLQGISVPNFAA